MIVNDVSRLVLFSYQHRFHMILEFWQITVEFDCHTKKERWQNQNRNFTSSK